ncbi:MULTISPECIES: RluA family pseudouridine synthase [Bacillaceae]|uniref:Pseudouridine synthase n=1 Tax=Gottfriedia luciferensis TaxID=178774 RepID=A0ABX2ZJ20_9BACI|nr:MULTISPECIES: RluA family pseudouridine synthase [Bacillaceae]ODG89701.1 RNA pseudouridine synthase [Gottfriedia luciferensis]PGZ92595.1 pseudouridine synthase [Bacillus sp. AFS029533]
MELKQQNPWFKVIIGIEHKNQTVESYLKNVWQFPKKLLHELRMAKGCKINGEIKPWNTILLSGDQVEMQLYIEEDYGVIPQEQSIEICYEDEHLLIANKPFGVDTHPNEKGQLNTLANGVAFHFQENGLKTKVRHIHRLDKDTTGGVVFAKHALSSSILDSMLSHRKIKRTYTAIVEGNVKSPKGTINEAIGRDRHHPTRRRVSPKGDKAITHYKKIRYISKLNITILECQLDTGRTHQIRVHLSFLGHPLIGDLLYGGKQKLLNRQGLHASNVQFTHPFTKENLSIDISYPADIKQILNEK